MKSKSFAGLILSLFWVSTLTITLSVQTVKTSGTIYIRADGSVDPPTAPISSVDNVTYTLTDSIINDSIVVQRDNIVFDGAGHTLQGTGVWKTNYTGIQLSDRINVTIKNVEIKAFVYGIMLLGSSDNSIHDNNITANDVAGILLAESSGNNTISANNITANNDYGIGLDGTWNIISGNNITNNENGIILIGTSYNNIAGNDIRNNGYGTFLLESFKNTLYENSITNNDRGVSLWYSSNNTLSGNVMNGNRYNLEVDGAKLGHFMHSIDFSNFVNGKPVYYLVNQTDPVINSATRPQIGYLALVNCVNATVEGLTLTNNGQGLLLAYTNNSRITNNNITNNSNGIYLSNSSNNIIAGNNVTNNWKGIYLYKSYNNTFYNNNFINKALEVYDVTWPSYSINTWDDGYPSGGNYWSDYDGNDTNNDGIGDTSYLINYYNEDNYPLMGMFHCFNTPLGYHINVISNSTIEHFHYFEPNSTIKMHVSNMTVTQTYGFCRIRIPHALINETYHVTIDGAEPHYVNYSLYDDGDNRWIYFSYEHSTLEIVIVPEFPPASILPLLMIITSVAVVLKKTFWTERRKA